MSMGFSNITSSKCGPSFGFAKYTFIEKCFQAYTNSKLEKCNCSMSNRLLTGGEYPQGILDVIEGVIGYLGLSVGYSSIEYAALRVLSNLYFSFAEDLAISALTNAESAGRTSILLSDIVLGLIDIGFDLTLLDEIPRKRIYRGCKEPPAIGCSKGLTNTSVLGAGGTTIIPRPLSLKSNWSANLRLGNLSQSSVDSSAAVLPPAPSHLQLPALPEPHTFLHTKVKRAPFVTDPGSLRRRIASQRTKVQQSLVKFLARVQPVQYLFPGDADSFMIIEPKKSSRPYLTALLADLNEDMNDVGKDEMLSISGAYSQLKGPKRLESPVTPSNNTNEIVNPFLLKPKFPGY